jgi:ketosteroid isomerase-like protein
MRLPMWPSVAAAAVILGCVKAPEEGVRASLMAVDRAFDSVVAVRGTEGWVSFFADSGIQVPDRGDLIIGHEAIRGHMAGFFADTTVKLRWEPDLAETSGDGTLGYTIGHWRLLVRDSSGEHEAARGKYLTTWHRQKDGSWKALADIGNTEPKE